MSSEIVFPILDSLGFGSALDLRLGTLACQLQHYRCCRVMLLICSHDCIRVNWVK